MNHKVYEKIESLGDNCEVGFVIRNYGIEKSSIFRWSLTPLSSLINVINNDFSNFYLFDNLEPFSSNMVLDRATGISFHSNMKSHLIEGNYVFIDNVAVLQETYIEEKAKKDFLLERFKKELCDEEKLYVIKSNSGINDEESLKLLDVMIKKGMHSNSVLLVVKQEADDVYKPCVEKITDKLLYGYISQFASYEQSDQAKYDEWRKIIGTSLIINTNTKEKKVSFNDILSNYRDIYDLDYSVHISPTLKYIYFNNPKCGCSSIKATLNLWEASFTNQFLNYDEIDKIHDKQNNLLLSPSQLGFEKFEELLNDNTFIKVSSIRDPVERVLSAYFSKIYFESEQKLALSNLLSQESKLDFFNFLKILQTDKKFLDFDEHWRPQAKTTCINFIQLDHIIRFDNLHDDLERLWNRLSFTDAGEMPYFSAKNNFKNENTTPTINMISSLSDEVVDLVYDLYELDYALFPLLKKDKLKSINTSIKNPRMNNIQWCEGIAHEVNFWDTWLKNKGGEWSYDFELRLNPESILQPCYQRLIEGISDPKILDVGSGPLTFIGKKLPNNKNVSIVATDALANEFNNILSTNNITPLVPSVFAEAENLSSYFNAEFDLVIARNCLDHVVSPVDAFAEMVKVVKSNGFIWIEVHRNEAIYENYEGFHQWNIDEYEGDIIVWSKRSCAFLKQKIDRTLLHFSYTINSGKDDKDTIEIIAQVGE